MPLDYDFRQANKRRTSPKMPANPLDKCTVVSIFPKPIHEVKLTLEPGVFNLPAGSREKPSILVVGTSSWWKDVGFDSPLLEISTASTLVADSIVKDYCGGLIGCNLADKMPGIFFILGAKTFDDVRLKHKDELDSAEVRQTAWYRELIRLADVDWARSNGNPLAIPDDARLAAQQLGLKDKPWMGDFRTMELIQCVACGGLRNPQFPICPNCKHIVDPELAKKLNIKLAS